jgi:hypothetical protein
VIKVDADLMKETLQRILEHPHHKSEQELADILNDLPPDEFDAIVNELLWQVSAAEVKDYGLSHFNEIDRYPNPQDGLLEREELSEYLCLATSAREKAILLWIWLAFDDIRESSEDFDGLEKAYDVVLTLKDFQSMKI